MDLNSGSVRPFLKEDFRGGVALDPDGLLAIGIGQHWGIDVWDINWSDQSPPLPEPGLRGVSHVTPDGNLAVRYSKDFPTVTVYNLETSVPILSRTLAGDFDSSRAVAISLNSRIAIASRGFTENRSIEVWDLASGEKVNRLEGHTDSVTALAVNADGRIGVSVSRDNTLRVWDVNAGSELRRAHCRHGGSSDEEYSNATIKVAAISADRHRVVCATNQYELTVWNASTGRKMHTLTERAETDPFPTPPFVALSGNGHRAVSASRNRPLDVWDLNTGCRLHKLGIPSERVTAIAISADGRFAICTYDSNALRLWDITTGKLLSPFTLDSSAHFCSFLVDGRLFADDGRIHHLVPELGPRNDPDDTGRALVPTRSESQPPGLQPWAAIMVGVTYGWIIGAGLIEGVDRVYRTTGHPSLLIHLTTGVLGLLMGAVLCVLLARERKEFAGRICSAGQSVLLFVWGLCVGNALWIPATVFSLMNLVLGWFVARRGGRMLTGEPGELGEILDRIHPANWLWLWLFVGFPAVAAPAVAYFLWLDWITFWYTFLHVFSRWRELLISLLYSLGYLGVVAWWDGGRRCIEAVARSKVGGHRSPVRRILVFAACYILCTFVARLIVEFGVTRFVQLAAEMHKGSNPWWVLAATGELFR